MTLLLSAGQAQAAPATFTVTNTNDSGAGSLRQAITDANTNGNPSDVDVINFNIPGSGVHTIAPTTNLPIISQSLNLNGYSQPGAQANTAISPAPINSTIQIEIAGTSGALTAGLNVSANNSLIQGVSVYDFAGPDSNFSNANVIFAGQNSKLAGSYIGVKADGMTAGDRQKNCVGLAINGPDNEVGSSSPADRNVFFDICSIGRNAMVVANSPGSTVYGNYMGIAKDGVTDFTPEEADANGLAAPFSTGINILNSTNTTVGGPSSGQGNVISGSIVNVTVSSPDNVIQGNYIGTDYTGRANAGITNGIGVAAIAGSDSLIGGTSAGEGNIIAGVKGSGVEIASMDVPQIPFLITPTKIAVIGNSIYNIRPFNLFGIGNSNLGIDLASFIDTGTDFVPDEFNDRGPTPNDAGDADSGANNFINTPVLKTAQQVGNQLTITYDLDAADSPSNTYRVEFFANDQSTIFGHGPGQTYLGAATSVTPGQNRTVTLTVSGDQYKKALSATTTALDNTTDSGFGSTSEFSQNIGIGSATDFDADGVSNDIEDTAPNNGDGNNDGTPDRLQPTVTSLTIASTGIFETFVTTGCSDNGTVASLNVDSLAKQDAGKRYPYGLTDFSLNCSRGDTVNITKYVFVDAQPTSYVLRKYNTTTEVYRDVPNSSISSETVGTATALVSRYSITDGGDLDDDGVANGIIVDPVGLATTANSGEATLANTGENTWIYTLGVVSLVSVGGYLIRQSQRAR